MMDISQPPRNSSPSTSPGRDEWRADLALRLARREGRTVLVERRERGPLAVQKALYPEGPEICHVVIIPRAESPEVTNSLSGSKWKRTVVPSSQRPRPRSGTRRRADRPGRKLSSGSAKVQRLIGCRRRISFSTLSVSIGFQTRSCPYRIGDRVGHGAAWQTGGR